MDGELVKLLVEKISIDATGCITVSRNTAQDIVAALTAQQQDQSGVREGILRAAEFCLSRSKRPDDMAAILAAEFRASAEKLPQSAPPQTTGDCVWAHESVIDFDSSPAAAIASRNASYHILPDGSRAYYVRIETLRAAENLPQECVMVPVDLLDAAANRIETCEEIVSMTSGRSADLELVQRLRAAEEQK